MQVKIFEVRDRHTFIPVFAMKMDGAGQKEAGRFLLHRVGYAFTSPCILVGYLRGGECHHSSYDWSGRTMPVAHKYIEANFDILSTGEVIDVEYILKEKPTSSLSIRLEEKLLGSTL